MPWAPMMWGKKHQRTCAVAHILGRLVYSSDMRFIKPVLMDARGPHGVPVRWGLRLSGAPVTLDPLCSGAPRPGPCPRPCQVEPRRAPVAYSTSCCLIGPLQKSKAWANDTPMLVIQGRGRDQSDPPDLPRRYPLARPRPSHSNIVGCPRRWLGRSGIPPGV